MIGQQISHYELVERLGKGGMSTVYTARDLTLDRTVAVKVFRPSGRDSGLGNRRFVREAEAVSQIEHPNVVKIHEVVQKGDLSFLIVEFIVGRSLREVLKSGRLEFGAAAGIAREVASGLESAHRAGVVHRDIKPENIMIEQSGCSKILDFGVAHLAGRSTLTKKGLIVGTMPYMAPEQLRSKPVDGRTDVYSLGILLFEMLAGKLPFDSTDESILFYQIMNVAPPSLVTIDSRIPRDLDRIVGKAVAKEPDRRYRSAAQVEHDLSGVLKTIDEGSGPAA